MDNLHGANVEQFSISITFVENACQVLRWLYSNCTTVVRSWSVVWLEIPVYIIKPANQYLICRWNVKRSTPFLQPEPHFVSSCKFFLSPFLCPENNRFQLPLELNVMFMIYSRRHVRFPRFRAATFPPFNVFHYRMASLSGRLHSPDLHEARRRRGSKKVRVVIS